MNLDPDQEAAVQLILTARLGVVTGGPGVGKTTCLLEAVKRLKARGTSVGLCAPTGKASRRMSEVTGEDAMTIHRLLKWWNGSFQHDRDHPLPYDVVIVDEASMLDVFLADALMDAIGPRTRLVLVGDVDQLPPVGPGAVFADIIRSCAAPVVRLTQVHRAARDSWVCRNAPRVLRGDPVELDRRPDFRFWPASTPADVVAVAEHLATESPGSQLLIPQRPGPCGGNVLNEVLQGALNPALRGTPTIGKAPHLIRAGDRVIQTRNNYDLMVLNGDVGTVADLDQKSVLVDMPDGQVRYNRMHAADLELAYALTVHKFQGSEHDHVIVVCHSTHSFMLSRRLFYTAITRAKKRIDIIGDAKGVRRAVSNARDEKRNGALVARINA